MVGRTPEGWDASATTVEQGAVLIEMWDKPVAHVRSWPAVILAATSFSLASHSRLQVASS
jgi:hypothetical protein